MQLDKSNLDPTGHSSCGKEGHPKERVGCEDGHGQAKERRMKTKSSMEVQLGQREGHGDTVQDSSPKH